MPLCLPLPQKDRWRANVNMARDWMFFSVIRHHLGWTDDQKKELERQELERRVEAAQGSLEHMVHRSDTVTSKSGACTRAIC